MNERDLHSFTGGSTANKGNILKKFIISVIVVCFLLSNLIIPEVSYADTGSSVAVTVDYTEQMAKIVAAPGGSTRFYMSTDGQKSWDLLNFNPLSSAPSTATPFEVDLSSVLSSRDISVFFKGNKDTNPVEVKLSGEVKNLTAKYQIVGGVGSIVCTGTTSQPIEYRKGANGTWKDLTGTSLPTANYEIKGATFYFRTKAVNGLRAGKMVTVRVSKKPAGPSVKLDGSKLIITGLKEGTTIYRVNDGEWRTADTKTLDLYSKLGGNLLTNQKIPAGTFEFYTAGSEKKLASAVKVIQVPEQPELSASIVSVSGASISITDSNQKKAYEYAIVTKGSTLNLSSAKWTSVQPNKTLKTKAVNGDTIYIRAKSYTDSATKSVIPASTYVAKTVSS